MDNLQVRLPKDDLRVLDALAAEMQASRSDAARAALTEGVRSLRLRLALDKYAAGEITLERAAEEAGVGLQRVAQVARDRGLPYIRYSADELERDLRTAHEALAGGGKRGRKQG